MARKFKYNDVVIIREDGVKVTMYAPREPKKGDRTWQLDSSSTSNSFKAGSVMGVESPEPKKTESF